MFDISYTIINGDITKIKADVIVNASNGVGFMGGLIGRFVLLPGVAEAIHYETKGKVEKEAKRASSRVKYLPRILSGHKKGEIFITSAGSLDAGTIIHAVTMNYPGMNTNIKVVSELLPKIINKAYELEANSIAIPLLGAGVGRIPEDEVFKLYDEFFSNIDDLEIIIVRKVNRK